VIEAGRRVFGGGGGHHGIAVASPAWGDGAFLKGINMSIGSALKTATPAPVRRVLRAIRNRIARKSLHEGLSEKDAWQLNFWRSRFKIDNSAFENSHYERLMLAMAEESTQSFTKGKIIADFGCGPRGSLVWATSALVRIGIDALADRYADEFTDNITAHGTIYVKCTEKVIPLPSDFIDVMFTMGAMRYVDSLPTMCSEILRVLKPGGELIGSFDLEMPGAPSQPQRLNEMVIKKHLLNNLEIKSYRTSETANEDEETYDHFFKGRSSYRPGQEGFLWVRAKKPI
jgi:SAM-dependent methyltransferase